MNYELAKQLKDAGFPFKKYTCKFKDHEGFGTCDYCQPVSPPLEELIEACGEGFDWLTQKTVPNKIGNWCAQKRNAIAGEQCVVGTTPTEAVARLWLALHKK